MGNYYRFTNKSSMGLYVAIILTFIFFIGYHILYPILPLYIVDTGASKFELGLLMSIFRGIAIIAIVPFGLLANRLGNWRALFISISIQLLSFLLYAIIPSSIYLYPVTGIYALSFASFGPISMTVALISSRANKRGEVMGRYFGSIGAAMILGPIIASFLTLIYSYKQLLFIISLLPIFCIILVITSLKTGVINFSKNLPRDDSGIISFRTSFKILSQKNILVIFFIQMTFYIATGTFDTLFPIYAKESLLLTASAISILYAARGLPNSIIRFPIGSLSDKIGRIKPIIISNTLAFIAIFLISDVTNIITISILMGIYGAAWGARIPSTAALLTDNVKSSDINIASSLLWLSSILGMGIGSMFAASSTLMLPLPIILKASSISILLGSFALLFIRK
ncbi:MAG: MFS transporter [Candidatus Bathyarchaeota archaeon]|nr:MFS transporter [Candidatus Bathyarchaeota archaeon]